MAKADRSIELLEELESYGFNDKAFFTLHHHRARGLSATIKAHKKYCERTDDFVDGGENELVQRRLQFVLDRYRKATNKNETNFVDLAQAAWVAIPSKWRA